MSPKKKGSRGCLDLFEFIVEFLNVYFKMRYVLRYGRPKHIFTNMYVIVYQHITHSNYRPPIHLRMFFSELMRQ